jgi:hypothetical protein
MRRWRFGVLVLLLVVLVLGAPVQAGGVIDFQDGFQALAPFLIVNAILTGFVSSLFINGCAPPAG